MSHAEDLKNAAAKFRMRRSIHPGRSSSLRKIIRGLRIKAGQRPLHQPMLFTAAAFASLTAASPWQHHLAVWDLAMRASLKSPTEGTYARLHPTKGWRFCNAI